MTKYEYTLSKSSRKFLGKTDRITSDRITRAIGKLSENPYGYTGVETLTGFENMHRIRIGKYRIVYKIIDDVLVIVVVEIDSRGGIYKGL